MFKKLLKFNLIILATLVAGFVVLKSVGDARYFSDYDPSVPPAAEIKSVADVKGMDEVFAVEREQEFKLTEFSIEARPGDRVPCLLTQPAQFEGKLPTIIFVHGSGQKKDFVKEICTPFNRAGFNMVSFDQWNCGERKLPKDQKWARAAAWYVRGWKAVNDTRRLADYLVTRPDVDPERLYLVGASYGAMTSTHILARDKRFKAGVLVVGGGDFNVMLEAPLIRGELARAGVPNAVFAAIKPLAVWLGAAFDPINSAAQTGPAPILMQCGEDDTLVTPDSGKELFAKLSAPKELTWYKIDHPGLRDGDGPEIIRMLDDGLAWLKTKAGITAVAASDAAQRAPVVAAVAPAAAQ